MQNILLRRETNMQISLLGREQHFIFSGKCETQKVGTWEKSLSTRKSPKRKKEKVGKCETWEKRRHSQSLSTKHPLSANDTPGPEIVK